jgi:uncharacterized protein YecT (DUF1311 family)/Na+-transporting methylmalonyl-CoA/oxaloacetate decarboxylase gamma subunit
MSTRPDALFKLADTMAEDILRTPDEEVLREVEEDYGDPRALANKFDQILERAEKQAFGAARAAASVQTQSSFQARSSVLYYRERMRDRLSTLFGNRMVWAGVAAVLIALILAPAVFRSISELNERSEQLAAQEKEQLARSEQLAAQEKELLARSEQLAAREKGVPEAPAGAAPPLASPSVAAQTAPGVAAPESPAVTSAAAEPILCENLTQPLERLICADADLAFWQNLVSEIYQHRWQQLDTNGQQVLRQGQLDWLKKMRADCNVPETGTWNPAEMARAKSCVLQSTKERVAVLSNN